MDSNRIKNIEEVDGLGMAATTFKNYSAKLFRNSGKWKNVFIMSFSFAILSCMSRVFYFFSYRICIVNCIKGYIQI